MSRPTQDALIAQFAAALRMLRSCVEQCPDERWEQPVVRLTFDQVAFHTLFFTDVYLGHTVEEAKRQDFHRAHAETFADYEELGGGYQKAHYARPFLLAYLEHCRAKAERMIAGESDEDLARAPGFEWLKFSRLEAHLYNVRHVQHHAGALSIVVHRDTGQSVPWAGSGWG